MNQKARDTEQQVELINIHDEEWLLYKIPKVDVTLIRGSIADENGNISIYREGYKLCQISSAEAAKACGGIVIVQVERIVKAGSIPPKEVAVPGIMVDYVFCAKPENHMQTAQSYYNPSFSGELRVPMHTVETEDLSARKVIARRAAMFLKKGDICNLGVGIPEAVSSVAAEEGVIDRITLTTEAGNIGGMPANKHDFGCCWNPEATIDMADNFDFYDGGCLDFGCLGILQVDPTGNINASKLNGEGIGVGGFMDVAAGSKTIAFTTIFVGRVDVEIGNGQLKILKEGNVRKFVNNIEQVSFNGQLALNDNKNVYYVTERAVFKLTHDGLELIEIAPGVDLQKDILDQMDYEPIIKDVKLMPAEIFNETWGGLAEIMDVNNK
jgi:propionate CoA-transferase